MPGIETDLKEIIGDLKQEFTKVNQRLDKIESSLTDLQVSQAELKGDIETLDKKVNGIGKRLENQEFLNRGIVGAAKFFGILPNP